MTAPGKADIVRRVIGFVLGLSAIPLFVLSASDINYSQKSDALLAQERAVLAQRNYSYVDDVRERAARSLDAFAPSTPLPKAAPRSQDDALRIGVFEGIAGLLLLLGGVMVFRTPRGSAASPPPA